MKNSIIKNRRLAIYETTLFLDMKKKLSLKWQEKGNSVSFWIFTATCSNIIGV